MRAASAFIEFDALRSALDIRTSKLEWRYDAKECISMEHHAKACVTKSDLVCTSYFVYCDEFGK
jgi:hypothetical protein